MAGSRSPVRRRLRARVLSESLTARRAAWIIGAFTVLVTLAAALLAWLIDREDFPSLGISAWWALQTVTTIGYGDFVPTTTQGKLIGAVVMVAGVGFLAVITASIAAAFVEGARRRLGPDSDGEEIAGKLDEILTRLERLEGKMGDRDGGAAPDPSRGDPER